MYITILTYSTYVLCTGLPDLTLGLGCISLVKSAGNAFGGMNARAMPMYVWAPGSVILPDPWNRPLGV